ncbi:S41 family peptidase [Nonlabens xiamenensis]|uniref:S41 family peptidase n=1 Tax=Nonlabens xiamenensis TaxID=2341043 RepID=UPI000F607CB0|nr:S41 family peptidase [Nonlabens xiamenensis]
MKTWAVIILLVIGSLAYSQSCECQRSFDLFKNNLEKTISFKTQYPNNEAQTTFDRQAVEIRNTIDCNTGRVSCLLKLAELSYLVKDEHILLELKGVDMDTDENTSVDIKGSAIYRDVEQRSLDLDSLSIELEKKSQEDIEGVYRWGDEMQIGISEAEEYFEAIILSSEVEHWQPGMVMAYLKKNEEAYTSIYAKKNLSAWQVRHAEKFNGNRWLFTGLYKMDKAQDNSLLIDVDKFVFKPLDNNTAYIRVGSFNAFDNTQKESKRFLKENAKPIKASTHLILDLRQNGGGADKVSKAYRKLALDKAKDGKVVVLVNNYTGSNAEITTVYLKEKNPNIIVMGEPSLGILSYGKNYSGWDRIGDTDYRMSITDMDYSHLLDYERKGVPIDIHLSPQEDWIDLALQLMRP